MRALYPPNVSMSRSRVSHECSYSERWARSISQGRMLQLYLRSYSRSGEWYPQSWFRHGKRVIER